MQAHSQTIFTIVAKNYLPLARSLQWSLNKNNQTPVKFIIFLADELEPNLSVGEDELIIPVSQLGISNLNDWAFKYTVTEFCTAVKPACFQYVFDTLNAQKAIYFDPDIFVFGDLGEIFSLLDLKEIVTTPHYFTPQTEYTGDQRETMTLFVGIFNFGFVAFRNSTFNKMILNWWYNRLSDQCFADRQDALHTDQKWADFLPVYAAEGLHISKSAGMNLAPWNLFERRICEEKGGFKVQNRLTGVTEPLLFVHFAGYDPKNPDLIHKDIWDLSIEKYPDYKLVRDVYDKITALFDFVKFSGQHTYSYSRFSNGAHIHDFHRRLYRALVENGYLIESPFDSDGWLYRKFEKSKMVSLPKSQKQNSKSHPNFEAKRRKINGVLKLAYRVLGAGNYFLIMMFFNRYSRSENHTFLLGENIKKIY